MSIHDNILIGIIIAAFSTLAGVVIGKTGKVSKEQCEDKRTSCNKFVCAELKHIKDEQKEMKNDIKELLNRTTKVIERVVN